MSQKTFCDICDGAIGEVTYGINLYTEDEKSIRIGKKNYREVCNECYVAVHEFLESLKS